MRREVIIKAKKEANRFLEVVEILNRMDPLNRKDKAYLDYPSQYGAAVKRASMDLTRALADMRRG